MTMEPEHHSNDPQLDDLISRLVESTEVPDGLADRVFRASASGLPGHQPLKFETVPPRRLIVGRGGRIAMAAAVAVACVVGARLMLMNSETGAREEVVNNGPDKPLPSPAMPSSWAEHVYESEGIGYVAVSGELSAAEFDEFFDTFEDEFLASLESEPSA